MTMQTYRLSLPLVIVDLTSYINRYVDIHKSSIHYLQIVCVETARSTTTRSPGTDLDIVRPALY